MKKFLQSVLVILLSVSSFPSLAYDNNYIQPKVVLGPGGSNGPVSLGIAPIGAGFSINISDLNYILNQIKIAEAHAARAGSNASFTSGMNATFNTIESTPVLVPGSLSPTDVSDPRLPYGLRQVDGENNNISNGTNIWNGYRYTRIDSTGANSSLPSAPTWGSSDGIFPRETNQDFMAAYANRSNPVVDDSVRVISNLISDQSPKNPAACRIMGIALDPGGKSCVVNAAGKTASDGSFVIPNIAPNVGAAAPYNGMFALFGQFFDHGLDLISKTGANPITINLASDDPLFVPGAPNKMVMPRTALTDSLQAVNTDTPWIDLSQAYSSDSSHQFFLREYKLVPNPASTAVVSCQTPTPNRPTNPNNLGNVGCIPVATGNLLGSYANPDGLPTWFDIKFQAANVLGINLTNSNVGDVPLVVADEYGKFIPGPNGFPVLVYGSSRTSITGFQEGNLSNPISTINSVGIGHAFINDMAFNANDPAVLDTHFVAGDGRVNENIGLTAIHTAFHSEHNRLASTNATRPAVAGTGSIAATLLDPRSYVGGAIDYQFACRWVMNGELANGSPNPACGASTFVGTINWNGERLFQAARFITEMEYQHIVFGEFARKVQPAVKPFVAYDPTLNPNITAEFAFAVYRYGHSQLNSTIERILPNGQNATLTLLDAFTNPKAFYFKNATFTGSGYNYSVPIATADDAAGAVAQGMVNQVGNEIDEFITDTLRNKLLGLPLDLASLNLARARDGGIASLNKVRADLSAQGVPLQPYTSWMDFSLNMRNPESLVNFVAAYGKHPTIVAATTVDDKRLAAEALVNCAKLAGTNISDCVDFMFDDNTWSANNNNIGTGIDDVDLWIGGLAESRWNFGSMLGNTMDYVFKSQMENLQESDRFYYLGRTAGMNLGVQLETNLFSELFMRNTNAKALPADLFATPVAVFDMAKSLATVQAEITSALSAAEAAKLTNWFARPNAEINANSSWSYSGTRHVIVDGTPGNDQFVSGAGWDTLRGNDGNDYLNAGGGNDVVYGGNGDDVISDPNGADLFLGGPGNDYISSGGSGIDTFNGGSGADFMFGGIDGTVMLGGPEDDFEYAGAAGGTLSGDDGNDWLEGGLGADVIIADTLAPFGLDINPPGNDVLLGGGSANTLDGGGGQDIFVGAASSQNILAGGLEFDWMTYDAGTAAQKVAFADLNLIAPPVGNIPAGFADTFLDVEALSGGNLNDMLLGDDRTTLTITPAAGAVAATGDFLIMPPAGSPEVVFGLRNLIPNNLLTPIAGSTSTVFDSGNMLFGGAGSDTLMGRGGNDLIDGDASVQVWLSVPVLGIDAQYGSTYRASWPVDPTDLNRTRVLARSMKDINAAVQSKKVQIADIKIIRLAVTGAHSTEVDVAAYSGPAAQYTLVANANGTVTVTDNLGGAVTEGVDTLRNIEVIRFGVGPVVAGNQIPSTGIGSAGNAITNTFVLPQLRNLTVTGTSTIALSNLTATWSNPGTYSAVSSYTVRFFASAVSNTPVGTCTTPNATTFTCTANNVALFPVGGVTGYATVTPNAVNGLTTLLIPAVRIPFSTNSIVIPTPPAPTVAIVNNTVTQADAQVSIPQANVVTGTVYTITDSAQVGKSCQFTGPVNTCTITALAIGTHSFTVVATVGANSSSPSAATSVNITAGTPQTISFGAITPTVTFGVAPFVISATATSALPVTFTITSSAVGICSLAANNTLTVSGAGSCTITANQSGNATWQPAPPVSQTLTISPAPLTITAPTFTVATGTATLPALTATYSGFVNGQTIANLTTPAACTTTTAYAPTLVAGSTLVTQCAGASSPNYAPSYVNGLITIVPTLTAPAAPTSVTFTAGAAGSRSGTLTWVNGSDGGAPIAGYTITVFLNGTAQPARLVVNGNVTSFVISNLVRTLTYSFTIQARNSVGLGASSARSNAVRIP